MCETKQFVEHIASLTENKIVFFNKNKVVAENDESNSTQSNDSETKSNKKNANRFNHE